MARPNQCRSRRLVLETLEDRLAPAVVTYVAGALVFNGLSAASNSVTVTTPSNNLVQIALNNSDTFTSIPTSADFVLSNANRTLQINTALTNSPVSSFQMTLGSAADYLAFGLGGSAITSTGVGSVTIATGAGSDSVTLNTINITGGLNVTGGTVYIPSTASLATHGGTISLTGQGNTSGYAGVNVAGGTVDAGGGNIQLTGTGGGTTNFNLGVEIWNGATVQTTGTGAVSLTGTGGTTTGYGNSGIYVASAGTQVSAGAGGISLTGYGKGSGTGEMGVNLLGGTISATLTGDVTIQGNGGTSSSGTAYGVYISNTTVSSQDGDVTITGVGGGAGSAGNNRGISVASGAQVKATGAGAVALIGTGGTTTGATDHGIIVSGSTTQITAGAGGVTLVGTGKGSGGTELGVDLLGGTVSATLSGDVTIQGNGSTNSSGAAYGVFISGSGAAVRSQDGDVTITGTGGGAPSVSGNVGISLQSSAVVQATGNGAVHLSGLGGNTGGMNNLGIFVSGVATQITAGTGGVWLAGTGSGSGINEHGVNLYGCTIAATLSGDVSIAGNGGTGASATAYGVFISGGTAVSAADGNVIITGTGGGTGSAAGNVGISIGNSAAISITGAGAVQMNGTGGTTSGDNNLGIFIYGSNVSVSAGAGGIALSGTANGSGNDEWGVQVTGSTVAATLTGDITIQGNGSAGGGQANYGLYLGGAGTAVTSRDGNITITGIGAGSASENFGLDITQGALVAAVGAGAVTLNGTGGNGTHDNYGVSLSGSDTVVLTGGGALSVTGIGQGAGTANYGINADGGAFKIAVGGALTLNGTGSTADTPAVHLTDAASIQAGSGLLTLMGDVIDLGDPGTVSGTGAVVIQPPAPNRNIVLGGAANVAGALTLTDGDLTALAAGFSDITIGRNDGAAALSTADSVNLADRAHLFAGSGGMAIGNTVSVPGTLWLNTTGAIAGIGSLETDKLVLAAGTGIGSASSRLTIAASSLSATGGSAGVFVHDNVAVALTALSTVTSAPSGTIALDVQGTATLDPGMSTLTVAVGYAASVGSVYTILHTTAGVSGQFNGLPEGALVTLGGNRYQISYHANDGSDVTLTRLANPASQLTITAPTQAIVGGLFTVTVRAADANGDADPYVNGSIQLKLLPGGPNGGKLSGATTAVMTNGVATFNNLSLSTAGLGYKLLAAGTNTLPSAVATINVAPTTHFSLSGVPSASTKFPAGASFPVTITALNAKNLPDAGYQGTVRLTSTDPQVGFDTGPLVTLSGGTATVNVTLKTAGKQTITVTDSTKATAKVTSAPVNVIAAATPTGFRVTGFLSPTLAGATHNFTVTAIDDYGNKVAGYGGSVTFSTPDAQATIVNPLTKQAVPLQGFAYQFTAKDGGVHTFSATFKTVGTQAITTTDASLSIQGTLNNIDVANLTANIVAPAPIAVPGQPLTFTLTVSEDGQPANTVFTYKIDWNGNGKGVQTVSGTTGLQVSHVYAGAASPTIHVTVVDKVGNVSPTAGTLPMTIQAVAMEGNDLYIGGTTGTDTITISPTTADGKTVSVTINKVTQTTNFTPAGNIIVYGQAGNDTIRIAPAMLTIGGVQTDVEVDIPALLFAGSGNTKLSADGSSANNVLVGGAGKDSLLGGSGSDILIGGSGASVLHAGEEGDVLISGSTAYDANITALEALIAEWGRTDRDYLTRIQHLSGTGTGGLNGGDALTPQTVFKSAKAAQLTGGAGLDWFWLKAADTANNINVPSAEVLTYE